MPVHSTRGSSVLALAIAVGLAVAPAGARAFVRTTSSAGAPMYWNRTILELTAFVGDPPPGTAFEMQVAHIPDVVDEPGQDAGRAAHILVVDDNATNRTILTRQATAWGRPRTLPPVPPLTTAPGRTAP